MEYKHQEAYCLMSYLSDDGTVGELIWNSRDGVTPFSVRSRDGVEMTHVDWALDIYAPRFRPPPGFRMFVTMDKAQALEAARDFVEAMWDHDEYPMRQRYESKDAATNVFAKEYEGGVTVVEAPARARTTAGAGRFA